MKSQHYGAARGNAVAALSMLLVAATASTSLAAAGPTGAAVPPSRVSAALPGSTPASSPGTAAGEQRWIPLLTGDLVAVNGKGDIVSIRPAKGREGIPVVRETFGGHTYAVPADARKLIHSGRLDRRLFDITTLSSPAYAQRQDLRFIVRYDSARPAARTALRAGTETRHTLDSINGDALSAPGGSAQLWSALTNGSAGSANRTTAPGIASVWLDAVVEASLDKSVPQIGAPQAWEAGFDGTGSRIAVLDTGIDATHPDLSGQVTAERNFTDSPDTLDRVGHGTHVASTAAGTGAKSGGQYKGVAPGAEILNGKVLGDGGVGDSSGIIAGMEWAVAEKADVVNLSLGGSDFPGVDPMEEAVNRMSAETGTLFVIAAGNRGPFAGSIGSPGSADAALTVGAVDKQDRLADFSSVGPRVGDGAFKPDLTAPGVDIGAALAKDTELGTPVADGYTALSGTSMATPHVAGAAAILAQQHPDWTGEDIKQVLTSSTTPGSYTAFQQGSGRTDLGAAIKQTAVARQMSLPFGTALWPHTDDQPITKDVTYRNLGGTPLTLKLTTEATGPDGAPAPSSLFTVDEQVTIAPGGEKTVKVTADTRTTGDRTGLFSGRVIATGGGQTIRTALSVELEAEAYTLTVKALDRAGKPADPSWSAALAGLSGAGAGYNTYVFGGTPAVRVPKGRYFLNGLLPVDPAGSFDQGLDFINQPRLDITGDTTVTLDARTTKPFDVTVPNRSARPVSAVMGVYTGMSEEEGAGFVVGYSGADPKLDPLKAIRTAHLGPKVNLREQFLEQNLAFSFSTGATGHDEYHLVYQPKSETALTGFTRHTKRHDFADVNVKIGTTGKDKFGIVSPGISGVGGGYATSHRLPYTGAVHLLGPSNSTWHSVFNQSNANVRWWTKYTPLSADVFKPGRVYRKAFNVGVFGPALPPGAGIYRQDSSLFGDVPLFVDRFGNINDNHTPYDDASTELHRDGKSVFWSPQPFDFQFRLGDERADYRLTVSITRPTVSEVSTNVTASWTFASESTANLTALPLSVVRFTPELSFNNTAKAGAKMRVPVSVEGPAAGRNLKSLTVWASYDKGDTWHKLTVRDDAVKVVNPRAGGSVSFKAVAVDKQGNAVEQTINDAYLTS
ncbi:S8 family peptidase [Streptomyces cadmiisoli]|uniref:S8 family peptidase n=1 Tax=Streptomyces cadmiisoli TaxID=2184053 RepID=UPI0036508F96